MLPIIGTRFRISALLAAICGIMGDMPAIAAEPGLSALAHHVTVMEVQPHIRLHEDHVLGTSLDMILTTEQAALGKPVMQFVKQEIAGLERKLSVWNPRSEISRLNQAGRCTNASQPLMDVVQACEEWRYKTEGAFDARLGKLMTPSETSVSATQALALLQQMQGADIQVNRQQRQIQLPQGARLAPDALAKGYIIDQLVSRVRQQFPQLRGVMIDIGGDIRVWGQSPHADGWRIGMRDIQTRADNDMPANHIVINNQAVAFSGQGARTHHGQSHLLDPHTGQASTMLQCTVVGTCAADADALATAIAAMPPQQAQALVDALAGFEAQWVDATGRRYESTGWRTLLGAAGQSGLTAIASDGGAIQVWPAGYRALIDLTIPKVTTAKYRAPYVTVWITDSQKKLVRTLAVWGKESKWIDSNYVWWRRYGRNLPNLDTVAKPSRQPGQYSLSWDGKDDRGQPVVAGQYIVHIETAREHGEHTYQTLPLSVVPQPSNGLLPAKPEIGPVNLQYRQGT